MNVHLVTGGAGFIAVNLISKLLEYGDTVIAVDDLSRGKKEFLNRFEGSNRFLFIECDCNEPDNLCDHVAQHIDNTPITDVWHLAANSDIPAGVANPRIDLQRTFMTTFSTLELMRKLKIPALHFASSSAIYGDLKDIAISEVSGPVEPISNYGAMKLASEAQIRAAAEDWLSRADIFRFPNVIGVPATHGVLIDFIRKLHATPEQLEVLGNGTQKKIYLHVQDLVDAMLHIATHASRKYNVYNIGPEDEGISVREIAEVVRDHVSPSATISFGVENRGWVGDVPKFHYNVKKLKDTGWSPSMGSKEAINLAVEQIAAQEKMA